MNIKFKRLKLKRCCTCGDYKERKDFCKCKSTKDKLNKQCRECANQKAIKIFVETEKLYAVTKMHPGKTNSPEWARSAKLKCYYKLTSEDFDKMYLSQKGLCAICGKPETKARTSDDKIYKLSVDHCHKTKEVRELLCNKCNNGIGRFDDNPELLEAAKQYLLKHKS